MFCIIISMIIGIFAIKYYNRQRDIKRGNKEIEMRGHYLNMISNIMRECWDEKTFIFNWDIWFDRRDEVIWSSDKIVLETIDYDFKCYGGLQVMYINTFLENLFESENNEIREEIRVYLKNIMKKKDNNIIVNLACMFSFKNGECHDDICPNAVSIYRDSLFKLFYGNIDWTYENIGEIAALGNEILEKK